MKLLNKLRELIKEKTNKTWSHKNTSMLGSPVSHRLRRLGPTKLPQPPPPTSFYRALSGFWENEHCGASAKCLNPVRRVWTVRIEASWLRHPVCRVWTPGIVARLGLSMDKTRGVSHCGLAIYIKKYFNAKEELWNSNISPCKNVIFRKPSKRTKIFQDIITLLVCRPILQAKWSEESIVCNLLIE